MLTLEIHDNRLGKQITKLLEQRFANDPERMMAELLRLYEARLARLSYSGRVSWPQDGLAYQQEVRREW